MDVDPGPIEERRRRHLAVVGELRPGLQLDPAGARQPFGHIGPQAGIEIEMLTPVDQITRQMQAPELLANGKKTALASETPTE